jgi:hypothetical protein
VPWLISFSLGLVPHHPDLNALSNDLLPFAQRMLAEFGEFLPFGGKITADGEHVSVGAKGSSEPSKSKELIDIMTDTFRREAAEGKIRAAGICFDVRVVPPGQVDKTDAIELSLEREGGDAVEVFVPYALLPDGEVTYGDMFESTRTPTMFVQPQRT